MKTFHELELSPPLTKAITEMGFEEATPIQEQTIPKAMDGKDLIGQAQTGTGKTAAFGIPLAEKILAKAGEIQGLVVAPTRELAVQVAEELNKIGQFKGIKALPIYGGQDINRQMKALQKRPHIIVGTPGRLMDHMRRRTIKLNHINFVVIDEADEMLNMGFIDDIKEILKEVPTDRQTLLFSATMPRAIQSLAEQFMKNPEIVKVKSKEMTVANTEQVYIETRDSEKFDVLCRLLDFEPPELAIVFARTKRRVDEVAEALNKRGYLAEGIHGDLTQARRDSVLRRFKENNIDILVATDVAARGLDISGVSHVYNFDIPQDPEGYVHRIGRTGRAGKPGLATTFTTPRELGQLKQIERVTKRKIVRKPAPSSTDAFEGQQRMIINKLQAVIQEGKINEYKVLAEEMLEQTDSVTLLSAALKMLTKEPDNTPVKITEESPFRGKKGQGKGNQRPKGQTGFRGKSTKNQKTKRRSW